MTPGPGGSSPTAPSTTIPVPIGARGEIAAELQRWQETGVGNGFNINPDAADGLEPFADDDIPILQGRGLFRRDHEDTTSCGHLRTPARTGGR